MTGDCQTTGYETRIRQDCEVVTETVCANKTVTRYNKEIQKSCTTRVSIKIKHFWLILKIFVANFLTCILLLVLCIKFCYNNR